ncbi:MAG: hypothetical protein M1829_005869 [Trizodia sp. TS-e1964]|nr:MAG: hypothetical protein M1829_005869 [Trizodia sp. TS-e1964]
MCIVLLTTLHPAYPLILLNNRDEFLTRPTAAAAFWPAPNTHVLGGRDLLRAEQGTWLGLTKQGRIAVLTNFREEGQNFDQQARSRGAMAKAWLTLPQASSATVADFIEQLFEGSGKRGLNDVGGFSLLCGYVSRTYSDQSIAPLVVISNRTADVKSSTWLSGGRNQCLGLSNSAYGDEWPKVALGRKLLREAVQKSLEAQEDQNALIERLFGLLSTETMPPRKPGEPLESYFGQLRHSIFIPPMGDPAPSGGVLIPNLSDYKPTGYGGSGNYGTQKQTVILIDSHGRLTFVERALADQLGQPVAKGTSDVIFNFDIESWAPLGS